MDMVLDSWISIHIGKITTDPWCPAAIITGWCDIRQPWALKWRKGAVNVHKARISPCGFACASLLFEEPTLLASASMMSMLPSSIGCISLLLSFLCCIVEVNVAILKRLILRWLKFAISHGLDNLTTTRTINTHCSDIKLRVHMQTGCHMLIVPRTTEPFLRLHGWCLCCHPPSIA